ncbi:glucose-1-phosphate thymidylyltransferase [Dyadobacter chenwenxiniae]|uniref:Glucose-1-phosphate thymidylyltransferase n=1 Tax=Dyadobacter chenwenxiniae TaxID=2906456 RepID=A0A9X1TGJ7_9BACT|nr:putative sugar nucleotidyl transferase [Dyadobacter chenwenxiniae]MCF0064197.1 glucose-1-phosphate thymidylyltransferase [Dyadobacter chenwenxiniae]UON82586.1 glucose-1-phosphate thymidylyltransferase [Dyadobacter chenwenxiniae]
MPTIILFDDPAVRLQLLPFTYTRPVSAIRCGISKISEKWSLWLDTAVSYQTSDYLAAAFPVLTASDSIYINGGLCPDAGLVDAIEKLPAQSALISGDDVLAIRSNELWKPDMSISAYERQHYSGSFTLIRNVWDIFAFNGEQIEIDFARITANKNSEPLTDPFTQCYNPENIFIESGAIIKASILNAEKGPIYIGKNALIQEGSMIQGPFSIGEGSVLAQGTKIRPNTTVGPFSKLGGEVSNCVIFGYSNKGHDGYLGNSVLGEWCNLGANTNNSNLKNDHSNVKLHSYVTNDLADTGLKFCGLMMGDYSKAGISTMFNTGSVVGVSVNVFGAGFQAKHTPSFSWGGNAEGFSEYRFEKALHVAKDTVSRRNLTFGEHDEQILRSVFEQTQQQRDLKI